MTECYALDQLARHAGIEDGWWDFFGTWRPVSADTKRVFLAAMGFKVGNDGEVRASLNALEARPWLRWLEPVLVADEHGNAPSIAVTLPASRDGDDFEWVLEEELGITHGGHFRPHDLAWGEERRLDGAVYRRRWFTLPGLPPLGYHTLRLKAGDGATAAMKIIVAPGRAYVPPAVADGRKAWGIATQLYALRTPTDWGVGTYAGLGDLAAAAGRLGAACVGINPLHALFPNQPERFSPYAPSSRRFFNVAFIDVEAIPEFGECTEAKRMFASPGFQASLSRVRSYPLVEYPDVAQLARPMLEVLYRWFRKTHLDSKDERGRAFLGFQQQGGRTAELFAIFEALQERQAEGGNSYWRHWPEELRDPASAAVADFASCNRERVEFFWWLQFIADQQLAAAQAAGKKAGSSIGLYLDLGVGLAGDGAEAWLEQGALALGVSVGAPPDPLALKGQDWGLLPFNPMALREQAYEPFIGVMAANMRHAGALRLDHAMALQRLYWVPPGVQADQGAYVRYPVDDLFRLVALESRRNHCLVIGEDLGTVPEGFRERMDRMGIFAYRVLVFEKLDDGTLRPPGRFDEQALAIFATHDLPSARGYWSGADIGLRQKLDLYPRAEMVEGERHARQRDREAMVAAFNREGLLGADFPTDGGLDDRQAESLANAAHAYLERSRAKLMMVQIEDVLGLDSQMNLPGTTNEHPNWRRRFPVEVDALPGDNRLSALAGRLKGRT
jgi:4-alpha-glucanotransferase